MDELLTILSQIGAWSVTVGGIVKVLLVALGGAVASKKITGSSDSGSGSSTPQS